MENDGWTMDLEKMTEPYPDQWEMMLDFMSFLDMRLYYLYKYHMWVGPENHLQNMMGLAVSQAEFEHNLAKAVDGVIGVNLQQEEIADIQAINGYFAARMRQTELQYGELPVLKLIRKFSLDEFAGNCLLLAFAVQLDRKYEKIFSYLQDDITKKSPTAETAIQLFALPGTHKIDYVHYFTTKSVLMKYLLEPSEGSTLFELKLSLRERLVDYLAGHGAGFAKGYWELFDWKTRLDESEIEDSTARTIEKLLSSSGKRGGERKEEQGDPRELAIVFVTGAKGSGRKFQIKQAVSRSKGRCLFINLEALREGTGSWPGKLQEIVCEGVLQDAGLCFTGFDALVEDHQQRELYDFLTALTDHGEYLPGILFITAEKIWKDPSLPHHLVKIDLPIEPVTETMRLQFWQSFTRDLPLEDIDLEELASKFRFTPGQIRSAVSQAASFCELNGYPALNAAILHKCCYDQVVVRLETLASKVKPAYGWEDLVLPEDQVELLQEACTHVKFRHTVYQQWGFDRKVSYGKGLAMLFSGPPGTGKTMAAQVIANQLHMEMYKIQLSQVVSKYIGETEKNLRQVFEEAKNANCILFFDETDALFGKRSEVKDSHDRHANIETAYLLQQIEEYDGVIIMATNLLQNIDNAFMRRINFVINFPFPDVPTRKLLWSRMLGGEAPLGEDVDLDFMARQFKVAGGNIKNIAVHAAFQAASQKSPITMKHLLKSAVNELRKNNMLIVKEELKEYADLIFD